MTTITLEVPDELAVRLAPVRQKLPGLLSQALELEVAETLALEEAAATNQPVFQETLNFLTSRPTPQDILMFKASPTAQERLEELLDKNREEGLTEEEETELDVYEQVNDLMILLKAHARTAQPRIN
jgi:hypothetical protein